MRGCVLGAVGVLLHLLGAGCGETRRPIGDECLRGDDCLSGVCSSRTCVAAPALVQGAGGPPPDETPRIPGADGGTDAPADAPNEGG
jgi:hypothetical protein